MEYALVFKKLFSYFRLLDKRTMQEIKDYIQQHKNRFVNELIDLLKTTIHQC